ncbi:hypothetical protein [Hyphomicrobium sp.]|uniref:hypothetical protein n=1 Tax=Hyphomicrobium sp. TaxID=82 RepID=UPI002E324A2A|nr:hypothetical protein [Hyphomicrobium sp.]HEX2840384.1 hypothetical protein [Hyphomicrobium sp.]
MTSLQLTAKDHLFLESLLHGNHDDLYHSLLKRKLENADVVLPELLDARTATIESCIEFSVGGGSSERRVLTRHEKDATRDPPLPVTTLRGLALLGLKAGDVFALRTASGIIEPLRLEVVVHPPNWASSSKSHGKTVVALRAFEKAPRITSSPAGDDDDPGPRAA